MVYAAIDSELKDTIKVSLGNIEPKEEIIVKLSYIETLKINKKKKGFFSSNSLQYELILPFTLTPRY
jgi:hypothetical protein